MTFAETMKRFRHEVIPCGCSGCREFRRVTTFWADKLEIAHESEKLDRDKQMRASQDALERACEEVLDAETLKKVVAAKRRIQGELKEGEVRK